MNSSCHPRYCQSQHSLCVLTVLTGLWLSRTGPFWAVLGRRFFPQTQDVLHSRAHQVSECLLLIDVFVLSVSVFTHNVIL